MKPAIQATDATLGAVVTDVDLAGLDDTSWRELLRAFHEHAVLIFPSQHLTDPAQVAFAERFGTIEPLYADHKIVSISNQRADGSVIDAQAHQMQVLRGNEGWHTDSSYMALSAKASVLSAQVLPTSGGETEWADVRAAYDALDADMQRRIADLAAYHSLFHSQSKIGHEAKPGAGYGFDDGPPPLRPLVKVHPETGRPALYIGRHAYGIPGLDPDESEQLLDELTAFACQAPRVYTHRWQPGDVAVWDNRCVLHRARPYDYAEPRVMMHTRIAGNPATESACPG